MITFSRLEKKGNLGNQLFQIAATAGIAVANKQPYGFPKWQYLRYFVESLPQLEEVKDFIQYKERHFHFDEIAFDDRSYDLEGWFQSEQYFDVPLTKKLFTFNPAILSRLSEKYSDVFSKKTILISIRRGDFVDHPDYFQLPVNYYMNALIDCFPDWESRHIILTSDDIAYCKFHFSFLENAFFCEGLSAIEQLAFATLCDDFIISNSTFSWWCAWLGEKNGSTVVRPLHNFSEEKNRRDNDKDYFPDRWLMYDHSRKKATLGNAAIILHKADSIVEEYLLRNFTLDGDAVFSGGNEPEYDRDIIKVYLDDCLPPPMAIYKSVVDATNRKQSSVFYLQGRFVLISRFLDYGVFSKQFDFGIFTKIFGSSRQRSKRILLVTLPEGESIGFNADKWIASEDVDGFISRYCQAGKISGLSGFKYFATVKRQNIVRGVKRTVKNIIKPKAKK
jgi:hypothetical protein